MSATNYESTGKLQAKIIEYISDDYKVTSQTETTAQLIKPKRFNIFSFFVMFGIYFLVFFIMSKPQSTYIYVQENGKIKGVSKYYPIQSIIEMAFTIIFVIVLIVFVVNLIN